MLNAAGDFSRPMIMNLRGITKEYVDGLDDIFESKFTENLQNDSMMIENYETKETISYKTPPDFFTSVGEWPTVSDLHCSYCDLIIGGFPFPEIEKIVSIEPFKAQTMKRYFCDALCGRSFIDREYDGQKKNDKVKFLKIIYDKHLRYECASIINDERNREKVRQALSVSRVINIPNAPDKTQMKKFSGDMGITTEEYRELKEHVKKENKIGCYAFA